MSGPPCRGCGQGTTRLADFGAIPLVDRFPPRHSAPGTDPVYPLVLALCGTCGLVQIEEAPPPEILFDESYLYLSSASQTWLDAARDLAHREQALLRPGATIVEIAANDGYQLRWFLGQGHRVIGVDPAPVPAAAARALGLDMREAFFDRAVAETLRAETGGADLILAKNVLAHVPHPGDLLGAMAALLRDGGRAVIEAPWLGDLIAAGAIDTIYHEHHSVLSVHAVQRLAEAAGLILVDVERLPFHGGSLRLTLGRAGTPGPRVTDLLKAERAAGLTDAQTLRAALAAAQAKLAGLRPILEAELAQGRRLAAYGAAAKGVVLLHLAGLTDLPFAYVADRNGEKVGRRMPGTAIEIRGAEALAQDPPDLCLMLSWNWADEILTQQSAFRAAGGRFLIPLPDLRWV